MPKKSKRPVGRPPTTKRELPLIGRELRDVRGALSLEAAAGKVGKVLRWWQGRETGETGLTSDDLELIGKAFDVVWVVADGRTKAYPREGFALPE